MTKLFALAAVLIVPLAACKKDDAAGTTAAAGGADCAASASHIADLAMADNKLDGAGSDLKMKMIAAMKTTLATRCSEDKWSDAFVSCTTASANGNALAECMKGPAKLTKEQSDKLVAAMSKVAEQVAPGAMKQYVDKSKQTEAKLMLNRLGKNAKVFYITNAAYPAGDAAQLPDKPCCTQADHKCPVSTAWATDKVWSALDFAIDEPTRFQYSYHGDAASFTATAVGDLDCDGKALTYTLTGSAPNGNPDVKLVEPPAPAQ